MPVKQLLYVVFIRLKQHKKAFFLKGLFMWCENEIKGACSTTMTFINVIKSVLLLVEIINNEKRKKL
jgi:hypothetical protein